MPIKYNLLDYGSLELVSYMGSDEKVVEDARQSIAGGGVSANKGPSSKLIHYLMSNKHTTPFEGCVVTFQVQAPIFVARQWMRHRTQSYNEMSARYGVLSDLIYAPNVWREQAEVNKQCSGAPLEPALQEQVAERYKAAVNTAYNTYRELLTCGVSREQARSVLPQSIYTRFRTTSNLWNFMHFMNLRSHPHAQEEIRVYSEAMENILSELFPVSMDAWVKYIKGK